MTPLPSGTNYFLGKANNKLTIIDVSNPLTPTETDLGLVDISNPLTTTKVNLDEFDFKYITFSSMKNAIFAYLTSDTELLIIDISSSQTPFLVGRYQSLDMSSAMIISQATVTKTYGYLKGTMGGQVKLALFDLSLAMTPTLIDSFPISPHTYFSNGTVTTNTLYLPEYAPASEFENLSEYRLNMVNITDPKHPKLITPYRILNPDGGKAVVAKGVAYIPTGRTGLRIIDVSHPNFPKEIGAYFIPPQISDKLVEEKTFGDYRVRLSGEGIGSLEVYQHGRLIHSQPAFFWGAYSTIKIMGQNITGDGIPDMVIEDYSGGAHCCSSYYIFELGEEFRWLTTFYSGNSPTNFSNIDTDTAWEAVTCDPAYIYWPSYASSPCVQVRLYYQQGYYQLDLKAMAEPMPKLKDLKDKAMSIKNSWEKDNDNYRSIPTIREEMLNLIYGGHADLAWDFYEWSWLSADIPSKKQFITNFTKRLVGSEYWSDIYQLNKNKWSKWPQMTQHRLEKKEVLEPISVNFPTNTVIDDKLTNSEQAIKTVIVHNNYAYLGISATLIILDITIPTTPKRVGQITLSHTIKTIIGSDNYVYVVSSRNATMIEVINVADPTRPIKENEYQFSDSIHDLALVDHDLYVAERMNLHIMDITNPTDLVEVGFYTAPNIIYTLTILDNYIYAEVGSSLLVLQFTPNGD